MKLAMTALIGIATSSCTATPNSGLQPLSPRAVTQNYSQYVGKLITVEGYLRYGDDARGLWTSKHVYSRARNENTGSDGDIWYNCVTLNADDRQAFDLRTLNNKLVIVTGVVLIDPHRIEDIFSFSCNDVALKVEKVRSAK